MAASVDATVGGTGANSYVTVAGADAYFDERLGSAAWGAATSDEKARAVIMATRRLEILRYAGSKTDTDQALQWPRYGVLDVNGLLYDSDAIPEAVKRATYELAFRYVTDAASGDPLAGSGLEGYSEVKVGELAVKVRGEGEGGKSKTDLPEFVEETLEHMLAAGGSSGSVRLLRA